MAQCRRPFFIKNGDGKQVLIPCNKCPTCKARRVSAWSFRIMQELKRSTSAYFITLKYNDTNLPITHNGYHTLSRRDLQLFFKRLRKQRTKKENRQNPIRYFAAGEYGGKIGRPHYHVILFNATPPQIAEAWSYSRDVYTTVKYKRKQAHGCSHREVKSKQRFSIGHVHYGSEKGVTEAAAGYTLKYILKPKQNWQYDDDDSQPEFLHMSKGIGAGYLTPAMVDYHLADLNNRMYCNLTDNKKISMPRYYKDKIYTQKQRDQISEAARNKMAEDILSQLFKLSAKEFREEQNNKEQRTLAAERKQNSLIKIQNNDKERKTRRCVTKIQNQLQSTSLSQYARGKYYAIPYSTKPGDDSKRANDQVRIRTTIGCRKNADL